MAAPFPRQRAGVPLATSANRTAATQPPPWAEFAHWYKVDAAGDLEDAEVDAAEDLEDAEVAAVVERIRARVRGLLRRRGYLEDEGDGGDEGRISLTEDHEEKGLLSLF